jgi:ribosome-binding factor A
MAGRRAPRRASPRQYPRTARLNRLLREILAEELELIDDERLELVTLISVDVDADLHLAVVYYDSLDGEEGDDLVLEALADARIRLKGAIGRQTRLKRVPELSFRPDPAVREGSKIEAILADIGPIADHVPVPDTDDLHDPVAPVDGDDPDDQVG